jgi:hypothetical protein
VIEEESGYRSGVFSRLRPQQFDSFCKSASHCDRCGTRRFSVCSLPQHPSPPQ